MATQVEFELDLEGLGGFCQVEKSKRKIPVTEVGRGYKNMNKGRTFHEEALKITIEGDISRVKMEELMVYQIGWFLDGGSEVHIGR